MAPRSKIAVPDVRGMRNLRSSVDTFVQTKPQYTAEAYNDKSKGLALLQDALGVAQRENADREAIFKKKKDKEDTAAATKAAMLQNVAGGNINAISGELLHPEKSTLFVATYNEKIGYNHAITWQAKVNESYQKDKTTIESLPSWLAEKTQSYLNSIGDNAHYIAGAYPVIQQTTANLMSGHAAFRKQYQEERMAAELRTERTNIYNDPTISVTEKLRKTWNTTQLSIYVTGQDRAEARADYLKEIIGWAKQKGGQHGIALLDAAMRMSDHGEFERKEKENGKFVSKASGLSKTEVGNILELRDKLDDDIEKDEKDARDTELRNNKDNTAIATGAWFNYVRERRSGNPNYIPSSTDVNNWVRSYLEETNGVDGNPLVSGVSIDENSLRSAIESRNSAARASRDADARGITASPQMKAQNTNEAILAGLHSTQSSNSTEDVHKNIGDLQRSNKYPHANWNQVTTQLLSSFEAGTVLAALKPFSAEVGYVTRILKYDSLFTLNSSNVGNIVFSHYGTDIAELNRQASKDANGTVVYGEDTYAITNRNDMGRLNKAVMTQALRAGLQSDETLRLAALGPDHPENKVKLDQAGNVASDPWRQTIGNEPSREELYNFLKEYKVIEPPSVETPDPSAELSDDAKRIFDAAVKQWESANPGVTMQPGTLTMHRLAAIEKASTANLAATGDPAVSPTSEGTLDIAAGVDALLERYGSESERRYIAKGRGRGPKRARLTKNQINNFLNFLSEVDLTGLYKSEDIFEGTHNRRKKTGTKKTAVPLNRETERELFNRYFDLTTLGMREVHFETLWNQIEQRLGEQKYVRGEPEKEMAAP